MAKKQLEIKGAERPSIPALDEAAEGYLLRLYRRMELQREEAEAKEVLEAAMRKHRKKTYAYADGELEYVITLADKSKLTAKRKRIGGEEASE